MKKIVAIRFSLKFSARLSLGVEKLGGRDAWFAYRSHLFVNTMQACLLRQTVRPDRIILLLSEGDEELFSRHLADQLSPLVTPWFSKGPWVREVDELLSEDLNETTLQFRLDSDDLIASDYIETISRSALCDSLRTQYSDSNRPFYIVAPLGFISNLSHIQKVIYTASPFIAAVAPPKSSITCVYGFNHHEIVTKPHLWSEASWMQLVHGSNADNKFRRVDPNFSVLSEKYNAALIQNTDSSIRFDSVALSASAIEPCDSNWPSSFPLIKPEIVTSWRREN